MSHGALRLLRIGRNTADLDRAIAFYRDALGFRMDAISNDPPAWTRLPEVNVTPSRSALLSLGAQELGLTEFPGAEPYPADNTSCDLWFQHCAIVVRDMHAACERVMLRGANAISVGGPQTLPPATGSVTAFKFRDPDGHPLELIHFPQGTGDPFWQGTHATRITLGIDHSAISVSDTERSIKFYGLLGLHIIARGVNRGIEQQRLDDLEAVLVDVAALQPAEARTPHLELLGYRVPRGRTNPSARIDAVAADRLVWQTNAIGVLLDAIAAADFDDAVVASGVVNGATLALLRDPDGHLNVLIDAVSKHGP